MSRLGLLNMAWGFFILIFTGFMGMFNAYSLTDVYLKGREVVPQWEQVLFDSAHGHLGLFGIIHVLMGLTFPYSTMPDLVKRLQTIGLVLGCFAMGPLLVVRGKLGPEVSFSPLGMTIGLCMTLAMMSLIAHLIGLAEKVYRRC